MKYILFILFAFMSLCAKAVDLEEFGNEVMYFYTQPTIEKFEKIQDVANSNSIELESAKLLFAVEVARISEKNGWPIKKGVFGDIALQILNKESELNSYINDDNEVNPEKLDIWWSSFFGTGSEIYLDKIFKYAGEEMPKGDLDKLMVIGAATWSFKANSKQHEVVKEYVLKKLKEAVLDAKKVEYLRECIAYASE